MKKVYTWNEQAQTWEERIPRVVSAGGNYFHPRTYWNMADHPVTVNSPGELKAALKKYDCYERG